MDDFFLFFNGPILIAYAFVIGACIGSFINVVNYRVPEIMLKEWAIDSVEFLSSLGYKVKGNFKGPDFKNIYGKSKCTSCGVNIKPIYNFPIFGWLFLRGKSACCNKKISKRYPITELFFGVAFAIIMYLIPSENGLIFLFLFSVIFSLSWIDFEHKIIPDSLLFFLSLPAIFFHKNLELDIVTGLACSVLSYLVVYFLNEATKAIKNREGIGMGDAKLIAVCSLYLGFNNIGFLLVLAPIFLILYSFFIKGKQIPFGPAISIAFFLILITNEISGKSIYYLIG